MRSYVFYYKRSQSGVRRERLKRYVTNVVTSRNQLLPDYQLRLCVIAFPDVRVDEIVLRA